MALIHKLFESVVENQPKALAIEEENRSISYDNLNRLSNKIANLLLRIGVKKETVVTVNLPSSIRLVACLLGIFKSQSIYLPISNKFSDNKLDSVFRDNLCEYLITGEENKEETLELIKKFKIDLKFLIVIDAEANLRVYSSEEFNSDKIEKAPIDEIDSENLGIEYSEEDSCYIFYTSGSTGSGNSILGIQKSLAHYIKWEIEEFSIGEGFRISQIASVTFDASFKDILTAICSGATLLIPDQTTKENPDTLLQWIIDYKVSFLQCVPSIFRLITKTIEDTYGVLALDTLKHVLLAGEMLFYRDVKRFKTIVLSEVEIVNLYGTTEATILKSFHRINNTNFSDSQPVHVGRPIADTFIAIINENSLCRIGEMGDVYIKTPFLTKGYLNNEELQNQRFVQNPLLKGEVDIIYKTGDLGRYIEERCVELLGRADDQVKLNGIRVELHQIENALMEVDGIQEAAVVMNTLEIGSELICFYTGKEFTIKELRSLLSADLNNELMPTRFIHLINLPVNLNGKVDKKSLKLGIASLNQIDMKDGASVVGEVEENLKIIWEDILKIDGITRDANFFELGGSSIAAIQMISRIYKQHNTLIQLDDIFNCPTIQELSEIIESSKVFEYTKIESVERKEAHNLSLSQKRIWMLTVLEDNNVAYNLQAAFLLNSPLDIALCEKAYEKLIQRHESLRTVFFQHDGNPKLRVLEQNEINNSVDFKNLNIETGKDYLEVVETHLDEDLSYIFDLSKGPLSKLSVLQINEIQFVLSITVHHLAADGWSIGLLLRDFAAIYESILNDVPDNLPNLDIQYIDFAEWQLNSNESIENKEQLEFWKKQLKGAPQRTNLETDFLRPDEAKFEGANFAFEISDQDTARLSTIASENNASIFMVLLSVFYVCLHKETDDNDIVVGVPTANRSRKELESVVGFFLNTLAIRVNDFKELQFVDLLKKVKNALLEGHKNQEVPFETIVNELNYNRDLKYSPVFQILFVMLNIPGLENQSSETFKNLQPLVIESKVSRFDITMILEESGNSIIGKIEYKSGLFEIETIELLALKYQNLINLLSTEKNSIIGEINYELFPEGNKKEYIEVEEGF